MPDQKCLPYGLIHFQYPITDTKSLPTPAQQRAITKPSLSPSRGKQKSTTVVPAHRWGSETDIFISVTDIFISVTFACTFKTTTTKKASFISFFFHPLPQTKQDVAGPVTMSTQSKSKHTSTIAATTSLSQSWSGTSSAAELGRPHTVWKQSHLKTSVL